MQYEIEMAKEQHCARYRDIFELCAVNGRWLLKRGAAALRGARFGKNAPRCYNLMVHLQIQRAWRQPGSRLSTRRGPLGDQPLQLLQKWRPRRRLQQFQGR